MSDELTSPTAGPFDVRTALLNIIGSRKEGVSQQELMRNMNALTGWRRPFYYEATLSTLVKEGRVAVSHCGMTNHKTRVYLLRVDGQYQKTCRVCQLTKPAAAFRRRLDSNDGYVHQCKLCENHQRREKGWANKSRKRRQRELRKGESSEVCVPARPQVVLKQEEVDAAAAIVKAESLEEQKRKFSGKARYIVVDGKVIPAPGRQLSPVEMYDRAWRRIMGR